jgi:hypothetical protein
MKNAFPRYIIALFLLTLFLRIVLIPYYDNNLGGIEPNVIYGIQRILQGQQLYQDPASGTWAIMQYTPLYYHFIAGLARLTSSDVCRHGLDVHRLYILCRVSALIFNLLTVLVCALIIRAWRFSWYQSVVFAMPVLICVTAHYYTRGDSLQLFLFVAAMWCYIAYGKNRSAVALLLASLFTAACVLTKQSGILCAGIITYCLLFIERRYLAAIAYVLLTAIISGAFTVYFVHGNWDAFYRNTVLGLKNGIDLSFLYSIFISNYFLDMVPCYILCGVLLAVMYKRTDDKNFRILRSGAAISWLFAAFTGLKVGSSNNYFTEFLAFIIVVIPYVISDQCQPQYTFAPFKTLSGKLRLGAFARNFFIPKRLAFIALFILITSKTMGLFTGVYIAHSFKDDRNEYTREQQLFSYFRDVLHIKNGEHIFFTERRFLDNIFFPYAVMTTKDVVTQVYFTNKKTFDYAGFAAQVNSGMIKYIVTDEKRNDINVCSDSLPFILFDRNHFTLLASVSGYCIFCFTPPAAMTSA